MRIPPAGLVVLFALTPVARAAAGAAPIPEKLVVLTFDDSSASHHAVAAPLLKRYGFGATFFITEGFTFLTLIVTAANLPPTRRVHAAGSSRRATCSTAQRTSMRTSANRNSTISEVRHAVL